MDFESAAQRLKRDQAKLRGRRSRPEISASAKREAQRRQQQQQRLAEEREKQKRHAAQIEAYYRDCERSLNVRQMSKSLTATSIHGEGDKIALPPSILNMLTSAENDILTTTTTSSSSPWIFRIGILNPNYNFPASPLLKEMEFSDEDGMNVDSDSEEEEENNPKQAFLNELDYKYLAYTHGTVVEFTQDEGHVGLPEPIAKALLAGRPNTSISSKRTVDPAKVVGSQSPSNEETATTGSAAMEEDDGERTPGHLAYGLFDVPDFPIEITMVNIPKGRTCQLIPTQEAISNGFYNLKDIKLVLEQSLVRTRATLSVGDLLHTWHRGIKYDLVVSKVTPSCYNTVTCINTDIEVDFGAPPTEPESVETKPPKSSGYTLGSTTETVLSSSSSSPPPAIPTKPLQDLLLTEPPVEQTQGICTVQIRAAGGGHGRRRFDVTAATMSDLFAFSSTIHDGVPEQYQLVSRFPRKEYRLDDTTANLTLEAVGLRAGQELLLVEKL